MVIYDLRNDHDTLYGRLICVIFLEATSVYAMTGVLWIGTLMLRFDESLVSGVDESFGLTL